MLPLFITSPRFAVGFPFQSGLGGRGQGLLTKFLKAERRGNFVSFQAKPRRFLKPARFINRCKHSICQKVLSAAKIFVAVNHQLTLKLEIFHQKPLLVR